MDTRAHLERNYYQKISSLSFTSPTAEAGTYSVYPKIHADPIQLSTSPSPLQTYSQSQVGSVAQPIYGHQQQQQQYRPVYKRVKEIPPLNELGPQPIPNSGWTDNTPQMDLTSAYGQRRTSHHSPSGRKEADEGWVVTPISGGGGGYGKDVHDYEYEKTKNKGKGGGYEEKYDSRTPPSTEVVWSWQDKGDWIPFDPKINNMLEEAYQRKYADKKYSTGMHEYCVDFAEMKQYRLNRGSRDHTKFRQVKREAPSFLSRAASYLPGF